MPACVTPSRPATGTPVLPRLLGAVALAMALCSQAAEPTLRDQIAANLVVPAEQRFAGTRWDHPPEIVALYFGAAWCGPCHAFTPELKAIRAALQQAGADTEVVYVSLDESEGEMRRYMRAQQMPWPGIDYRRLAHLPAIRRLGGLAPPNLVLVDRQGTVLASGWEGRRYRGLQPVLQEWMTRLSAPPSPLLRDSADE